MVYIAQSDTNVDKNETSENQKYTTAADEQAKNSQKNTRLFTSYLLICSILGKQLIETRSIL